MAYVYLVLYEFQTLGTYPPKHESLHAVPPDYDKIVAK